MSEDMEKIFALSVNKIEHSRTRNCGKASMLHRTLLVNSVINRVKHSEKRTALNNDCDDQEMPLMNYREPKSLDDLDEYESEKTFTERQTRSTPTNSHHNITTNINQPRKISSLVTKLNSRSLCGKFNEPLLTKHKHVDEPEKVQQQEKENIVIMDCQNNKRSTTSTNEKRTHNSQKRIHCSSTSDSNDVDECPKKKLRCIWPNNISQDINFSITGLATLFGDLVATNNEADMSNIPLNGNFATAMVAC